MSDHLSHPLMIDVIEIPANVRLEDVPDLLGHDSIPQLLECMMRVSSRTESVGEI